MADSKIAKKAARLEAREKRRQAAGEVMVGRMRTLAGFAGAYLGTQVLLPAVSPAIAENQALVDGALAVGGGIAALVDDGALGDVGLGVAMVGTIQTLDTLGAKIQAWRAGMG